MLRWLDTEFVYLLLLHLLVIESVRHDFCANHDIERHHNKDGAPIS